MAKTIVLKNLKDSKHIPVLISFRQACYQTNDTMHYWSTSKHYRGYSIPVLFFKTNCLLCQATDWKLKTNFLIELSQQTYLWSANKWLHARYIPCGMQTVRFEVSASQQRAAAPCRVWTLTSCRPATKQALSTLHTRHNKQTDRQHTTPPL